jgi:hypothetical protein
MKSESDGDSDNDEEGSDEEQGINLTCIKTCISLFALGKCYTSNS